jgi:hypothetical protein
LRPKWRRCYYVDDEEEEGSDRGESIEENKNAKETADHDAEDEEMNRKFESTLSFVDDNSEGADDSSKGGGAEQSENACRTNSDDEELIDSAFLWRRITVS